MMDIWKEHSEAAKKERWKALWAMEDLPRPLWFIPASPILARSGEWIVRKRSVTPLFTDREIQFQESIKFNRFFKFIQNIWSHDDFVLHLQPQFGVGVFASAFGCQVEFPPDQMPWTHFKIKAGDPAEKVYELKPPGLRDGLLGQVLDWSEYFDKQAGYKYPIAMTDLQGPIDSAYLVWDSCDFMTAMYEHPQEVHHLMRMVTDIIIKSIKEVRTKVKEFVPAHFPPVYLPDGMGITVSEDALAVLSTKTYEEFSLPYLNELSEEFGGVVVHSCGNFEHQLGNLKKVSRLRGINFGVSETRFEAVWDAFAGKTAIIPHCSSEIIVADFKNAQEWVTHVLQKKTHNKGLALMVIPAVGDIHKLYMDQALGRKVKLFDWELVGFGSMINKLIKRYS